MSSTCQLCPAWHHVPLSTKPVVFPPAVASRLHTNSGILPWPQHQPRWVASCMKSATARPLLSDSWKLLDHWFCLHQTLEVSPHPAMWVLVLHLDLPCYLLALRCQIVCSLHLMEVQLGLLCVAWFVVLTALLLFAALAGFAPGLVSTLGWRVSLTLPQIPQLHSADVLTQCWPFQIYLRWHLSARVLVNDPRKNPPNLNPQMQYGQLMFRHWFLALTREIRKPRSHQKHVPLNLTVLANHPGTLVGSLNLHLEWHSVLSKAECVNPKVSLLLSDQLVLTYFVLRILPSASVNKHLDWLKSDA